LIGPETYKHGDQSAYREVLILRALNSEIEYDISSRLVDVSMAIAPRIQADAEGINSFSKSLIEQIEKLQAVRYMDHATMKTQSTKSEPKRKAYSIDSLVAMYKLLSKTDALKKITE
jgi:hypothetical protein